MTQEPEAARLYIVTPAAFDPDTHVAELQAMLSTGAVACLRLDLGEGPDEAAWIRAANHLLPPCHEADVPLVIAEHHRLVGALGLDGVHIGRSRAPIRDLRKTLGRDAIIGAFGGAERHRAMSLAEAGADYVSLGPVRVQGALGDGAAADDALFQWWSEMIETPVVAEGGVTLDDARRLAAITDFVVPDPTLVWGQPDPAAAVSAFAEALR
ncbi:thiamine phosphate synthase [Limibaculum sp. M0105]|uniref:Thiamine phosphate synthase n=1 Tax=Thermohalobaculum xanthum TaxID=2753746 RepID=A0A8J7M3F9_9RHOB|nr:thiamine phosphate synthase [Thermohalobaculum xanthum]MBK0397581.1 thiamine phosphate synthase [Thermohalobaculum xanthum]